MALFCSDFLLLSGFLGLGEASYPESLEESDFSELVWFSRGLLCSSG